MIPAGFEYHRPADIASALGLLQIHGDEARVIAGGHSLIPMMKLRMAEMGHLVDLQDIDDLKGVDIGHVRQHPKLAPLFAFSTRMVVVLGDRAFEVE